MARLLLHASKKVQCAAALPHSIGSINAEGTQGKV
jgi:hypothetical protein